MTRYEQLYGKWEREMSAAGACARTGDQRGRNFYLKRAYKIRREMDRLTVEQAGEVVA